MKDRKTKKCISPWFKYLAILSIAVVTLLAIYEFKARSEDTFNNIDRALTIGNRENEYGDNVLIASSGVNLKSDVAVQFETCRTHIIVNPKTKKYISFANNPGSFDIKTAQKFISQNNVEAVITGTMNMDTYQMLNSLHVDIYTGVTGNVKNALKMYENHELIPSESPNRTKTKIL